MDEQIPRRAKRGNEERPERVPTEGHEGPVEVGAGQWNEHNRRKDTADALLDRKEEKEDPSDHSAGGRGITG